MANSLYYRVTRPGSDLSGFVESFWLLRNLSPHPKEAIILPDGRVDLFFSQSDTESFQATLLGISTQPEAVIIASGCITFAISFKLPAIEYLFPGGVASLLNSGQLLPPHFWGVDANDLDDFNSFCRKASQKIQELLSAITDSRKEQLFRLMYESNGAIPVKELAEKVFWSSRQINRYFNQQFGLSLKAYCDILRFRASFSHIKEGKLYPQEDFADQSHFIREIKKLSGALPKELHRNQNDRFIQFSTLPSK